MKKRLLAFVLTFALVISLLPTTVLAVEDDRAVNGIYQDGTWQQSGTGSITDPGTGIELSKTATPDPSDPSDPNLYTIQMQVKTSTKTTVTNPDAAAVVLVMDLSNSMKTCAECGKDPVGYGWDQKYIHDENCTYYNPSNSEAEVQNDQTRLYAAKNAALAFLKAYAGETENANRQLAVVAFGTTSKTVLSWTNVAGTSSEGYSDATLAINSLEIGFENRAGRYPYSDTGGTNLEAGLQLGANLIGMDAVSQVGSKNVIALTDGVPTFQMSSWADRNSTEALCAGGSGVDGSGSSGSEDNNNAAQRAANDAKTNGATLYTVCYGVADDACYDDGPTIGRFLSGSIASDGCAYNADNTADLNEAFEAITESITSGIEGAGLVVTDPMGENIQLVAHPAGTEPLSGQDGFTWTLSDPVTSTEGDTTYYTYTLTYQIRVDANAEGFDEDAYHPANQPTYLTIPGEDGAPGQQIYFPVPGVKGTTSRYTVTYLPGEHGSLSGADGSVIHEDIKHGNPTPDAPAVTAEEGYYFIGWKPTIAPTVTADATYIAQYAARTEITVKANSGTFTYDGTEKTVSGFETLEFERNGVTFTVEGLSASASGTDAGTYPVEVTGTAVVKDSQDRDVTSQFIVKTQDGELKIEKRNVTLTSATDTKQYDGTPLTNHEVTVDGDGFVEGEGATYNVTGTQTVKGSSANTFTYTLNDGTKEGNYNISKTEGTLTVIDRTNKYEITVVAKSDTVTYDGQEHTVTEFETLTFEVEGQTYTVSGLTANGSGTDAGTHTVIISGVAKVLDANHYDVSDQFTVKTQHGTLTITKRDVTLTSATDTKQYDGTPLTNDEVTVSGDGFVEGEGATYNVTGSQTLVGSSSNHFTYELQGDTKADNYNITVVPGQLTVTNRDTKYTITVEANSSEYKYDGTEKTVSGFKETSYIVNGQTYTVEGLTAEVKGTNAGEYTVNVEGTPVVKDFYGNVVTDQFTVNTTPGTLTITKRNVTLTSADDSKMYDGTPLTNDEVTVGGDGFVAGEGATYTVTGSQTLVGESDNAFTYVLNAGTKAENYEITAFFGKLTVTDRPEGQEFEITVKANSGTFTYDGTEKTVSGFETLEFERNGVTFTVEGLSASASGTDAGTYPVEVTGTAVVKDSQGNNVTSQFIVKTQDGELEIEKRNVTLTSATAQKEYDGTPLTNDEVTVGGDGFAAGEGATYNVTGTQTVKGSSPNTFTYTLNDGTKEGNYNISKTEGTLTVIDRTNKYEITVVAKSDTVTYDGQEHTVTEFETLTFEVEGQTYTVSGLTANGSGTNAGTHTVTISGVAKVLDANQNDVTDQFTVKTQHGKLEIKKRNVTLTSATDQKEYDGTPLTNDNVTVSGDGFVEGEGATYTVTGSQTLVGSSPNYFTYELQGDTKADNYNITVVPGQLTVTNRDTPFAIALQAKSDTVLYDGTEHSVEGFVTTTFTFGDATFTVEGITAKASGTDAKQYTTETDGTAVVKDADGNDVSKQFAVTVTPGTLTITKRNVTLTSADDTKMYDGTPLTNDEVTVGGDGFAAGEGATYTVTGSQTLVGESDNAFTYVLNAGTKADNYEITTFFGKLTVTDRPEGQEFEITVKANSGTFIYDGTEKTVSGFETLEFERNGVTFTVEGLIAEASATNLGTYPVEVTGTAVVKDSQGNDVTSQFIVNTVPGELTILGRLIYDGNAQQSGLVSNIPEDNNSYETTREVELSSQVPTHTNVNDVPVLFLGWSLTKSNEIFEAGEDYGTLVNKVTFADASITVYAVWGYDRNQDTIPDARQVLIQPADITIYTGGDGYMGTVEDENGNTVGINNDTGLPEPGFYFTLPYEMNLAIREAAGTADTPADLSSYLKITATADPGTGTTEDRSWTISLYSDTNNSSAYGKYVYRFAPGDEQNPVRMQFTDEEGNIIISDEFEIENALYQNYVMSLYQGSVLADTVQAVVSINGQTISAPVGLVDGALTIRGVTDEGKPSEILPDITMPVSSITAVTGEKEPTYYINGSQIPVSNQEAVQLLVDEIVDDEEQSVRNTLLELANVEVTDNTKTQFKYLDLVDTSNGHVWATMGADDSLTVYWPYPEGTDQDSSFTLLHYKGLDREFAIENLEDSLEDVIVYSTADDAENKLICTDNGIQFTVSSFSPFALIWTVEEEEPPYIPPYIPPYRPPVAPEQPAETPDTLNTEDHYSYIVGFVDGTVRPDASITRAEVAAIFFRLLTDETRDLYWSTTNRYTDVDPNAWYNNAVSTLSNMGILNGYDDGTFRPGATITRAEFTKIAVSFFDYADLEAEATFSDLVDGAWYESFIAAAAELGLIEGYEGNVFRPDATISRAEACTIVNRTLGRAPEKDHLLPDDEMITWPDNSNKDAWYYAQIQEATNSHDYEWQGDIEQWTGKLKERDWAALEKAWSDAYSAPGGEVMD